jgi:hypothetical protein
MATHIQRSDADIPKKSRISAGKDILMSQMHYQPKRWTSNFAIHPIGNRMGQNKKVFSFELASVGQVKIQL